MALCADNPKPLTPCAIRVTHQDVDANGAYYNLQLTMRDGQVIDARYHTSTNSTNSSSDPVATSGSSNGTQGSGSVPVEVLDPALTGQEQKQEIRIDPKELQAAIDGFERGQALGFLEKQQKQQDQHQAREKEQVVSLGAVQENVTRNATWGLAMTDLSFLQGTGSLKGTPTREFENNLARADENLGIDPQQQAQAIPAHVKDLALAAVGRMTLAVSNAFSAPNGSIPGMDFAHKSVIPATRMPMQPQQTRAFAPA